MSTDNELTLQEAQSIVNALDNPIEWRNYTKRSEPEKLALGVVILNRVMKGQTLRTIEAELNIPRATCARYRDKALEAIVLPTVDAARKEELDRLEKLIEAVWPLAASGDKDGIASYMKISERRSKILGLDSPIQIEQQVTEVTAAERELQEMLAQADRDAAVQQAMLKEVVDTES